MERALEDALRVSVAPLTQVDPGKVGEHLGHAPLPRSLEDFVDGLGAPLQRCCLVEAPAAVVERGEALQRVGDTRIVGAKTLGLPEGGMQLRLRLRVAPLLVRGDGGVRVRLPE